MNHRQTRRGFLASTTGLCAGAALSALSARGAAEEPKTPAWPVTVRDSMLHHAGEKDCWAALRSIGAEGVEVSLTDDLSLSALSRPGRKYSVAGETAIARLKADSETAGQKITALCMYNRFEERPEAEVELATKAAKAARTLGAPAVRIDVVPHKLARPEFLKLSIATLRKLMTATEETGVAFAIENHGNTTNDPAFLQTLFDGVGSRRLGLTLDTGNFYWFGHPLSKLYELYETFAPRVFHTHCKSIHYPAEQREKQRPMGWEYGKYHGPIYSGDIDFRRVVAILRKAGYANDLCVEDESLGKATAAEVASTLTKEVRLLKELR